MSYAEEPLLSESERNILHSEGEFIISNVIPITVLVAFWAIYLVIACKAIGILCKKGITNSKPRMALLSMTIIMFLFSTALMILGYAEFLVQVIYYELGDAPTLGERESLLETPYAQIETAFIFIFVFQCLFGDAIVIWRTWAVWANQRRVIIVPMFLWLTSLILLLIATANHRYFAEDDSVWDHILLASQVASAATNAVSTGLIAYKAWSHRRLLKSSLSKSNPVTVTEKILILFLESGCIYLTIWLLDILIEYAVQLPDNDVSPIVADSIDYMTSQVLGIYPTIIIILVEQKRMVWDVREVSQALDASRSIPNSGNPASSHQQSVINISRLDSERRVEKEWRTGTEDRV